MQIVLVEPEIPPNTGSIARLCAATDTPLHLVGKLGFSLDDKHLRRAGLDYWPYVKVHRHDSWADFVGAEAGRYLGFSSHAGRRYTDVRYEENDVLVFGGETSGLPETVRAALGPRTYRIPILTPHVRSLNLANAVSIVLYEGLRQLGRL